MTLSTDLAALDIWIAQLPRIAMSALGESGSPMFTLDFIMVGAVKRSMSLAAGLRAMVDSKNMVCARALLRLQIDTLSRLRAYTYVTKPEELAQAVLGGAQLNRFKSAEGEFLKDRYLIDRLSNELPWLVKTYKETSGYVHFSERQFFDTVQSVGGDVIQTLSLTVSAKDDKFPEESWVEVVACFSEITNLLAETVMSYAEQKKAA